MFAVCYPAAPRRLALYLLLLLFFAQTSLILAASSLALQTMIGMSSRRAAEATAMQLWLVERADNGHRLQYFFGAPAACGK
jgi:hypothetical protein